VAQAAAESELRSGIGVSFLSVSLFMHHLAPGSLQRIHKTYALRCPPSTPHLCSGGSHEEPLLRRLLMHSHSLLCSCQSSVLHPLLPRAPPLSSLCLLQAAPLKNPFGSFNFSLPAPPPAAEAPAPPPAPKPAPAASSSSSDGVGDIFKDLAKYTETPVEVSGG
jgi:hypothetical protein